MEYLKEYIKSDRFTFMSNLKTERSDWINRNPKKQYGNILSNLPPIQPSSIILDQPEITIDSNETISKSDKSTLNKICTKLIPWRKGPFNLFDIKIDAEWRSDMKWERLNSFIGPLKNKSIMDIGCNNGYFMFKMAKEMPKLVLGIDPLPHYQAQFNLLQHYARIQSLHFELFGVEHLNNFRPSFDLIFSMGIIYHHRNPIEQLQDVLSALKPGGTAILETIGIPGKKPVAFFPEKTYAKMNNVWFVPTISCFINWVKRAKFIDLEIISNTLLTAKEQRNTKWCPSPRQSLEDFLDPLNKNHTVEGHPAPRRFLLIAKKRK